MVSGPVSTYIDSCKRFGIKKPNQYIIEQLEDAETLEDFESLDLGLNYVGPKGMMAVMDLIKQAENFADLTCGPHNAELSSDNPSVDMIMEVAASHPSLTSIDFMGNPVTTYGGKRLLNLARSNQKMLYLHTDDDALDEKLLQKIKDALETNMQKVWEEEEGTKVQSVRFSSQQHLSFVEPMDDAEETNMRPVASRRRTGVSAELRSASDRLDYTPVVVPKDDAIRDHIRPILKLNPLFRHLDESEVSCFLDVMFYNKWEPGHHIIEQGEQSENFYIIAAGTVEIIKQGTVVCTFSEAQAFGELELMYNTDAVATVKAQGEVETWAISRRDYQHLMMDEMVKKRKKFTEFLSKIPITHHLSDYEKIQIADALETKVFEPGETVIKQGDRGDVMYIIISGTVEIQRTTDDGDTADLGTRGPGDYFGEFEFLFHVPRFCDVRASSVLRTAFINKRDFELAMGPTVDILKRNAAVYRFYVTDDGKAEDRGQMGA